MLSACHTAPLKGQWHWHCGTAGAASGVLGRLSAEDGAYGHVELLTSEVCDV